MTGACAWCGELSAAEFCSEKCSDALAIAEKRVAEPIVAARGRQGARPRPPFDGRSRSKWRGPEGRRACRWCGREIPERRRSWCSDDCVVAYLGTDWPALRRSVLARSGGLCALCGIDVPAFRRRVGEALLAAWRGRLRGPVLEGETELPGNLWRDDERRAVLVALGDSRAWPREPNRDWWEADHVLPVVLGGRDELSNLRLLCVPCHKGETRALARRRAEERKDAKIGGRLFGSSIAP